MSEISFDGVTADDFEDFETSGYTTEDALDISSNLLRDAVPCLDSIYPTLSPSKKDLVKFAIFEMSKYLKMEYANFKRVAGPFQSESFGSYSYSKMGSSANSGNSGVPGFDRAVSILGEMCPTSQDPNKASAKYEEVFSSSYPEFIEGIEGSPNDFPNVWIWREACH